MVCEYVEVYADYARLVELEAQGYPWVSGIGGSPVGEADLHLVAAQSHLSYAAVSAPTFLPW